MASTALTIIEAGSYPVLAHDPEEFRGVLEDILDGDTLTERDLPRVKVPSGGGTTWEVGDDAIKALDGILIAVKQIRTYWPADADDGAPPTCRSEGPDHKAVGIGEPGGKCSECPLAQYGTKEYPDGRETNAQACTKGELWFMLRSEGIGTFLPLVVKVPPSSLQNASSYKKGTLGSAGLRKTSVVTRLTLAKQENGKESYSTIEPTVAGHLSPDEALRAQTIAAELRSVIDDVTAAEAQSAPAAEPVTATVIDDD